MDPVAAGLKGIDIRGGEQVKMVTKPWGWEKWLAHGKPEFPYAFKMIHIKAPHKTSLQFHQHKQESNFLLSGSALLHYSDTTIDLARYAKGGYSKDDLDAIVRGLKIHRFKAGEIVHVLPGHIHRIEALEDITLMETSTTELDDVVRLQDDAKRPDGRIEGEHK
jgi:mannose-6-phosphate isomerase-like protein (cupin superfamily)